MFAFVRVAFDFYWHQFFLDGGYVRTELYCTEYSVDVQLYGIGSANGTDSRYMEGLQSYEKLVVQRDPFGRSHSPQLRYYNSS